MAFIYGTEFDDDLFGFDEDEDIYGYAGDDDIVGASLPSLGPSRSGRWRSLFDGCQNLGLLRMLVVRIERVAP